MQSLLTDPWFYAVAIPAVILTGLSKGGFLGGIGGVAVPIMSLAMVIGVSRDGTQWPVTLPPRNTVAV